MSERRCVFAGRDGHVCTSRPQWHHPIKKQRIRDRFKHGAWLDVRTGRWNAAHRTDPVRRNGFESRTLGAILQDERNRIWACWDAHQAIEGDVRNLPEPVWEFAREFGLDAQLENDVARQRPVGASQ